MSASRAYGVTVVIKEVIISVITFLNIIFKIRSGETLGKYISLYRKGRFRKGCEICKFELLWSQNG